MKQVGSKGSVISGQKPQLTSPGLQIPNFLSLDPHVQTVAGPSGRPPDPAPLFLTAMGHVFGFLQGLEGQFVEAEEDLFGRKIGLWRSLIKASGDRPVVFILLCLQLVETAVFALPPGHGGLRQ